MFTYFGNPWNIDLEKLAGQWETDCCYYDSFCPIDARSAKMLLDEKGRLASKEQLFELCQGLIRPSVENWPGNGKYIENAIHTVIDWAQSLSLIDGETPQQGVVSMKPKVIVNEEFLWFQNNYVDLKKDYYDQWIAIANKQVISSGNSFMEALQSAREKGFNRPLITRISHEGWER